MRGKKEGINKEAAVKMVAGEVNAILSSWNLVRDAPEENTGAGEEAVELLATWASLKRFDETLVPKDSMEQIQSVIEKDGPALARLVPQALDPDEWMEAFLHQGRRLRHKFNFPGRPVNAQGFSCLAFDSAANAFINGNRQPFRIAGLDFAGYHDPGFINRNASHQQDGHINMFRLLHACLSPGERPRRKGRRPNA